MTMIRSWHTIGTQKWGTLSLRCPQTIEFEWLGGRDSNPDSQIQSLVSYHWTTSQQRTRIYVSRPANVNRVVSRIAGKIFIAANTGYSLLSSLPSCAYS